MPRLKVIFGVVCVASTTLFFAAALTLVFHSSNPARTQQPTPPPFMLRQVSLLDRAKQEIPGNLTRIYQALDGGNPKSAASFLDGSILDDFGKLDSICKPFTYRAHYIETVVERPDKVFELRVRVLFKPLDEEPQILRFGVQHGDFVMVDILKNPFHCDFGQESPEYQDWFRIDEEGAAELARKFMYAAKSGREQDLRDGVVPGLSIQQYTTDSFWTRFFTDCELDGHVNTSLRRYKGLKIEVRLELHHARAAAFFVERIGDQQKIVWAAPFSWNSGSARAEPGVPFRPNWLIIQGPTSFEYPEDPELEARTLSRFGLNLEHRP